MHVTTVESYSRDATNTGVSGGSRCSEFWCFRFTVFRFLTFSKNLSNCSNLIFVLIEIVPFLGVRFFRFPVASYIRLKIRNATFLTMARSVGAGLNLCNSGILLSIETARRGDYPHLVELGCARPNDHFCSKSWLCRSPEFYR